MELRAGTDFFVDDLIACNRGCTGVWVGNVVFIRLEVSDDIGILRKILV